MFICAVSTKLSSKLNVHVNGLFGSIDLNDSMKEMMQTSISAETLSKNDAWSAASILDDYFWRQFRKKDTNVRFS